MGSLFDDRGTGTTLLIDDQPRKCWVKYTPDFLKESEAWALYEALMKGTPFEAERTVMWGKLIEVKRKSFAYGAPGLAYHYAGVERTAARFTTELDALRERVEKASSASYNFVLCNLYLDGDTSLGWHSDDERELVSGATIASISLGAERDFDLRLGNSGGRCARQKLAHGSLLLMGGETQRHYQHCVPKRAACDTPRINLTFRAMR